MLNGGVRASKLGLTTTTRYALLWLHVNHVQALPKVANYVKLLIRVHQIYAR